MRLHEIGVKYGTDKAVHEYLDVYERYLEPYRDGIRIIIEVGIHEGASLRMWRDWFVDAKVIGIDINNDYQSFSEDRIECYWGDQGNVGTILDIIGRVGGCDLFIDDGSHEWPHQLETFHSVWGVLRSGAVYIMEDLQSTFIGYPFNRGDIRPFDYMMEYVNRDIGMMYELVYHRHHFGPSISLIITKN